MGYFFALIFIILGVRTFFNYITFSSNIQKSLNWKLTTGTIIKSKVNLITGDPEATTVSILYEYAVNGKSRTSDKIWNDWYNSKDEEKLAANYPIGTSVSVYYDPTKPENSIIELGRDKGLKFLIGLSLVLFSIGLFILYLTFDNTILFI